MTEIGDKPPAGFVPLKELDGPPPGMVPVAQANVAPSNKGLFGSTDKGAKPGHGPLAQAVHAAGNVVRPIGGSLMKTAGSGLGMVGTALGTLERGTSGLVGGTYEGGIGEGLQSAVGDMLHPNDTAAIQHHQDEGEAALTGNLAKDVTNKYAKGAMDFTYQMGMDPLTYAGGGIVKGALKGATGLAKLVPGAEDAFNAARRNFVGSSHLDKAGITGAKKVQFKGIEGSEHGRMQRNVADFEKNIGKHLNANPATPPDHMTSGKITDTMGGQKFAHKQVLTKEQLADKVTKPRIKLNADGSAIDKETGEIVRPAKAANDTAKSVGSDIHVPKTENTFNEPKQPVNLTQHAEYKAVLASGRAMGLKGPKLHAAAYKAAKDAHDAELEDAAEMGEHAEPPIKAPGSPRDAAKPPGQYNVPQQESSGSKAVSKATAPVREPGETDAEFARRQFLHLHSTDEDFHNAYEAHRKASPKATVQQAAIAGARAMFMKHHDLAVIKRAKDIGIDKSAAEAGLAGFTKNENQGGLAKLSRAIGDTQKAGMFANWMPHAFGNVGQNSWIFTGTKGLAKASKYTINPKSISPRTLAKMDEYGADHTQFDPLETLDTPSATDGPLQKFANRVSSKASTIGTDLQKVLGSNKILNNAERGARASAWEHFEAEAAKKAGVHPDELTPEQLHEVGQEVRSAIGDYRNKSNFVKLLENRFGAQFPQYRAIAIGNTARAAFKHPERLMAIYRSQDDANKDVIQDPQYEYTLGGIANSGNKFFSSPSDYARGPSVLGPVYSGLLNAWGAQNANIAGSVPASAGSGYSNSTAAYRAADQVVRTGTNMLPAGGEAAQDAIENGKNPLTLPGMGGILLDAFGFQKHHRQQPKDIRKIDKWVRTGKPFNSYRDPTIRY